MTNYPRILSPSSTVQILSSFFVALCSVSILLLEVDRVFVAGWYRGYGWSYTPHSLIELVGCSAILTALATAGVNLWARKSFKSKQIKIANTQESDTPQSSITRSILAMPMPKQSWNIRAILVVIAFVSLPHLVPKLSDYFGRCQDNCAKTAQELGPTIGFGKSNVKIEEHKSTSTADDEDKLQHCIFIAALVLLYDKVNRSNKQSQMQIQALAKQASD